MYDVRGAMDGILALGAPFATTPILHLITRNQVPEIEPLPDLGTFSPEPAVAPQPAPPSRAPHPAPRPAQPPLRPILVGTGRGSPASAAAIAGAVGGAGSRGRARRDHQSASGVDDQSRGGHFGLRESAANQMVTDGVASRGLRYRLHGRRGPRNPGQGARAAG